jgi:2-methylcitrate dehydratase PrpD
MTELQTALAHLRHLASQPIPEAERRAAELVFVDTIGCALGGATDEIALATARALGEDSRGVGILGLGRKLRPADAMLVHGASIRCMDFNDVFSRRNNQHPSEFVIPVVLALAEQQGWSGARAIEATAIGYRIFLAMGESWEGLLGRGWAPSATLGRATSAALVGILKGLDDKVIANAMAIAAITAPTLGVVFKGQLSHAKSLVNGMATRAGWEALDLAEAGLTGPMNAFEGTAGFDQMAGGAFLAPDPAAPMLTAADVSLKAFPTVFMTHAAIASAVEVAGQLGGRLGEIASITVHAPQQAVAMTAAEPKWHVRTREEAQFSLPVSIAATLASGACGLAELSTKRLAAPGIDTLLGLMTVEADPQWTGYEGGRVTIKLKDGQVLKSETSAAPGHPKNPMTDAQVRAKFTSLVGEALGPERAAKALEATLAFPQAPGIGALMAAADA